MTDGQFCVDPVDVSALRQITATRNGVTRVSRGTILFGLPRPARH